MMSSFVGIMFPWLSPFIFAVHAEDASLYSWGRIFSSLDLKFYVFALDANDLRLDFFVITDWEFTSAYWFGTCVQKGKQFLWLIYAPNVHVLMVFPLPVFIWQETGTFLIFTKNHASFFSFKLTSPYTLFLTSPYLFQRLPVFILASWSILRA
jgi:hypothetical protein